MTVSKFLDSSAWLSYFFAHNKEIKEIMESGSLLLSSVISVFEVKRKLILNKFREQDVKRIIDFMKERSIMIDLTKEICEEAVTISIKNKLHTVDSLIYASAFANNAELITGDPDFKGMKNVRILT